MKVYFGLRTDAGCKVFTWDTLSPKRPLPLAMAHHVYNHSPDGPEWGFEGSGPAQLALAMLYDATGDQQFSLDLHQAVKRRLVACLPKEVWARTEHDLLSCCIQVAANFEQRRFAEHYLVRAHDLIKKGK